MQPKQSKKLISKYKNGISFIGVVLFIFLAVAGSYFLFTPNQKNADYIKQLHMSHRGAGRVNPMRISSHMSSTALQKLTHKRTL